MNLSRSKYKNTPTLRFPGFDGEWEEKKLGEVFERIVRKNSENNQNVLTISAQQGLINQKRFFTKSVSAKNVAGYYLLHKNEFAYNKSYSKGYPMGAIKRLNRYAKGVVSTLYICFRLKSKNSTTDFLEKYFDTGSVNKEIAKIAQEGARDHGLLNMAVGDFFNEISITLPSLPEQQKIASFLTSVDSWIENLKTQKEKLEEYKKGMMQKIFAQEIRFKDENGKDYPEWEEKKLGEVADVRDGTHDSPKYQKEGYPLITSKNLGENGSIDLENVNLISRADFALINKRSNVDVGDILFGMIGTIGNPVLVKESGFAIKNVALIKQKGELLNTYLYQYLKSNYIEKQFHIKNAGGTQKFIALGVIRSIEVPMTKLSEQKQIVSFLSSIDRLVESKEKELIKANNWKKGLMQGLFI